MLRGPYAMPGIKLGSTSCKAKTNTLPAVPSLGPLILMFSGPPLISNLSAKFHFDDCKPV